MATRQKTDVRGEIKFDHNGIGTILSHYRLKVPANQREYSWKDKHVIKLLEDFSDALHKPSYFLGTLVLTPGDDETWEVADGQQRLATTTILLAAIRDYFYEKGEHHRASSIENDFLFKTLLKDNAFAPRLALNLDDHQFFVDRILSQPNSDKRKVKPNGESHKKIARAAELAAEHLRNNIRTLPESSKVGRLIQWAEFIRNNAQVIVLKVPDDINAFVMFETLNDRGLKVSQADLVKNYLLGEADDRREEAQHRWAKMVGALETIDIEDITISYLRHLLSSNHGLTPEREVFERIKNSVSGKGAVIDFLDVLVDNANDYVAILNPDSIKWNTYNPSIRNYIRTLNELRAVPLRHMMLPIVRYFPPRETEKAFRLFISWAVRFLVTGGGRGGTLEKAYADRAKEIAHGEIATTKKLIDMMADKIPSDSQFQHEFAVVPVPQSKLARYYLRALELNVKGNPEPELVPNEDTVINLEHILPENPGKGWGGIKRDIAHSYYQRLGNMVLLQASKNAEVGNKSFEDKLPILRNSAFFLTKEVANFNSWNVKQIDERQERLAKLALKTWPIDAR
jgi:hypothetical protein